MSHKLYGPSWNIRVQKCLIAAKIANIQVDLVEVSPA